MSFFKTLGSAWRNRHAYGRHLPQTNQATVIGVEEDRARDGTWDDDLFETEKYLPIYVKYIRHDMILISAELRAVRGQLKGLAQLMCVLIAIAVYAVFF